MKRYFTLHGLSSTETKNNVGKDQMDKKWKECVIKKMEAKPSGPDPPNDSVSTGYTYFGQFLAHDITYFKHLGNLTPPKLDLPRLVWTRP